MADKSKLVDINASNASLALEKARHSELLAYNARTADSVLAATEALIKFLEGQTTKTEVVNQLESIKTPDVEYVVKALNVLDDTLKTHENTDLSGVTALLNGILDEASKIPKELPTIPEQKVIDHTKQFDGLTKAIQAVEKVVKAQKLVAEAPIVNVPETNVNVDAPDLKPLQDAFKDVAKAVNGIVIPEFKTDNKEVEKLLKQSNKILQNILEKPVGGGGGGGSSWTAIGTNGFPAPLNLDVDGNLKVTSTGGGGAGDASAANQVLEIAQLTAINANQTNGNNLVQGNVGAGVTDAGNPVKAGGVYNSTTPTYTTGQRGDIQVGSRGSIKATLFLNDSPTAIGSAADNVDGVAVNTSASKLFAMSRNTVYDSGGNVWNRMAQPVTDTQIRATPLPVSGTVTTGGLTDTQLRATPVPVSGTVTANTGLSQPLTDAQLRNSAVPVSLTSTTITGSVAVTGTFFQATQPVSIAATIATKETQPTTEASTNVTNSTSNQTALASNANRRMATFYNDDTLSTGASVYLKCGATASATSFKIKIAPGGYYELPQPVYTGVIDVIATAATGTLRVTETT